MESKTNTGILYSYSREVSNDEEQRKRYAAYMQNLLRLMAEQQQKIGGSKA